MMRKFCTVTAGLAAVLVTVGVLTNAGTDMPGGKDESGEASEKSKEKTEMVTATFGAGCFWGVEATFRQIEGVKATAVGYCGGHTERPTYRDVCSDETGHAEVVEVQYDPSVVPYEKLLQVFWEAHDPTQVNRQGPDIGSQYRSVIFYHTPEQEAAAKRSKEELDKSGAYKRPVATSIEAAQPFWRAEEYHQQYLEKRGLSSCKIK
jgi:peptide-methionine (S)-S-oxide reductase